MLKSQDWKKVCFSPIFFNYYEVILALEQKKIEEEKQAKREAKELKRKEAWNKMNLFNLYLEDRLHKLRVVMKRNNDIVDISDDDVDKKKKRKEKKEKRKIKEVEDGEIVEEDNTIKRKKKKRKDEQGNEIPKKKKRQSSPLAIEYSTSSNFVGPQKPKEFNLRDPTPFISALTAPQLAIENKSLKAEWNDPKNPLTLPPIYISNDDSMPMPFRIVPPAREPVIKPEDMVFQASRCITHVSHNNEMSIIILP